MSTFIPYGRHYVEQDDIDAVIAVLRSGSLTGGALVEEFEQDFAKKVGARYAVACSSGTAGLHLASLALGLKTSMLVVVPTMTFLATANTPTYTGAKVVFADVNPDTGIMDVSNLEEALERAEGEVKVIYPVHLNGQVADMESIKNLCDRHGIYIIEDACHALGGEYRSVDGEWHFVGSCRHSDMAVFSMHPVKNIAMGEGGMVTTNDERLSKTIRRLRNHGMVHESKDFQDHNAGFDTDGNPNPWYYEMQELGFNYRVSEIHCALGFSQLRKLDRFLEYRRRIANAFDIALNPLAPIIRPIPNLPHSRSAWHLYVIHVYMPSNINLRAQIMRNLNDAGFGTQVHYRPVHKQPFYGTKDIPMPGAERYYNTCLTLPLHMGINEEGVRRCGEVIAETLSKN